MANLKDIRKRRKGAQNTKKITRTMELVSSAKFRKAQDAALAARPYAEELRNLILRIAERAGKNLRHPLLAERPVKTVLIGVATSDRGLCGCVSGSTVAAPDCSAPTIGSSTGITDIGHRTSDIGH